MMNEYIKEAIERKLTVRIITTNGYQMCGIIIDEGESHIVVRVGNNKKMIYKHTISTIEAA